MQLRITRLLPTCPMYHASESALSIPEPNLSDPRSSRLSDAAHFSNSSDVVCISSGESDEPPPHKKKLTDFFPDCWRPGLFVNMIASNCCPYGEFKTHHFVLRNAPTKRSKVSPPALMFRCGNLNIRHTQPSCSFQFYL